MLAVRVSGIDAMVEGRGLVRSWDRAGVVYVPERRS